MSNLLSLAITIKGTDHITTQIAAMKLGLLKNLDMYPLPFDTKPLGLFPVWHRREDDDPFTPGPSTPRAAASVKHWMKMKR